MHACVHACVNASNNVLFSTHNTVINTLVFITVSTLLPRSDIFIITDRVVHCPTGGLPNVMPHIHVTTQSQQTQHVHVTIEMSLQYEAVTSKSVSSNTLSQPLL